MYLQKNNNNNKKLVLQECLQHSQRAKMLVTIAVHVCVMCVCAEWWVLVTIAVHVCVVCICAEWWVLVAVAVHVCVVCIYAEWWWVLISIAVHVCVYAGCLQCCTFIHCTLSVFVCMFVYLYHTSVFIDSFD